MRTAKRTNLQIRGLPEKLHDIVRRRAAKKGLTMSQYVIGLIEHDRERLALEEWLENIRRHPIAVHGDMSAAQALREAREERAEHLASLFRPRARPPSR